MSSTDFFRARLDEMIDMRQPLAVLAQRLPWQALEAALSHKWARLPQAAKHIKGEDLLGEFSLQMAGGVSPAGRRRLSARLMLSLMYLKNTFNLSDEELVQRWSENVQWQFFSGLQYYEPRVPCDATQIGRFRTLLGEDGLEQLFKVTIETAVHMGAVQPQELERIIVDTTVQEKAIAHPVDSRLLEIARHKVVSSAKRAGIKLKQTYAKEGKTLRRKAGGYAHAKQFKRMHKVIKRQRTILGVIMRQVQRQLDAPGCVGSVKAVSELQLWLQRAQRIYTQKRNDKNKLYALHAPEVECIGKGKARKPYEFGVKVSLAVTHKQGLMVGARSFAGNPYDGHTLREQVEQTRILMQDLGHEPKQAVVDLGYRGVDADNPGLEIIHRGKFKSLSQQARGWLKRRQAIEPLIGHTKADHGMQRCWLKGSMGDTLHALCCALGYNIRWLMRAIARLGLKAVFLRLLQACLCTLGGISSQGSHLRRLQMSSTRLHSPQNSPAVHGFFWGF